jgi:serine/threonine protein kinase
MNSATEHQTCPNCGAAIPANAPQGVCPKCLMAAAAVSTEDGQTGGKRPEPPSLERLAAAFPQLEVIEFIGQGGMGAVYKARQKQLDRIVALKVLPPGIGGDPSFAERFTREAKALAKLLHPNIVALFEFGQADGIYYLLMEFVDGVSLGQLLRASRVSAREALAIVPQICDALQYAHDQGIVHRDIKPENILLDRRGRVKVADFGLAKLVDANAPLTPSLSPSDGARVAARPGEGKAPVLTGVGKIMGTPNYMAPEQVEHPGEVDHRADIYALGVVFYQMLTGELPGKRMEPPSRKVQIDVRLDEVVMRALEKDPGRRYSQASVLKTQVETIAATPGGSTRREEARTESGMPGERRSLPWAWAAVASAAVCCLTFLAAACLTFFVLPESFESTARIKTGHPPDRNFFQVESELIKSELILDPVIEDLKLKEAWGRKYNGGEKLKITQTLELLRPCIELSSVRSNGLIEIHVFRERPDEAARIANAIADAYRQHRANQSALFSQGLVKRLEAANGKIAAARQELDQLQKVLSIGEAAAQQSRDPALADAKERPYWQKKRDLEDLLRFRNQLASQILSQSMGDAIPQIPSVEIVDRAVPALHPARPNKPLNLALGAAGGGVLGLLAGGLVLLFGSRRVRPGGAVLRGLQEKPELRHQQVSEVKTMVETIVGIPDPSTGRSEGAEPDTGGRAAEAEKRGESHVAPAAVRSSRRPWSLIVVAGLFMLTGCSAAWDIGSGFHKHIYSLNFGLLCLSVGIGLLRLRRGWRVAALIMIGLPFILGACLGIVALFGHFTFVSHAKFLGYELTGLSRLAAMIVACTLISILLGWMSWVLTRSDVKALFQRTGPDRAWIEWAVLPMAILTGFVLSSLAGPTDSAQSRRADPLAAVSDRAGFGPVKQVSATTARNGDIGVRLNAIGTVESSNSVMFVVPENYCQEVIHKFDSHQALAVEADNRQGVKFGHGFLVGVDNRIDPETATLKCRASLVPEGENLMVPGLFLNIHLMLDVKHGVIFVPADAILRDPQGALVWAIKPDQTVSVRHVQAGTTDRAKVEIQSGLSPGDLVVCPAIIDLRDGEKIRYKLVPPQRDEVK